MYLPRNPLQNGAEVSVGRVDEFGEQVSHQLSMWHQVSPPLHSVLTQEPQLRLLQRVAVIMGSGSGSSWERVASPGMTKEGRERMCCSTLSSIRVQPASELASFSSSKVNTVVNAPVVAPISTPFLLAPLASPK